MGEDFDVGLRTVVVEAAATGEGGSWRYLRDGNVSGGRDCVGSCIIASFTGASRSIVVVFVMILAVVKISEMAMLLVDVYVTSDDDCKNTCSSYDSGVLLFIYLFVCLFLSIFWWFQLCRCWRFRG